MPPLVFFLTLWAAHPKIRLVLHPMRTATRRCWIRVAVPVLLSAALLAGQAKPGNVVVNGKVWVDGKAVEHSTNLFPGEQLRTERDGSASITSEGTDTLVSPSSALSYQESYLNLDCGTVRVETVKGYAVHDRWLTVTPSSPQAKFEVTQSSQRLMVHALEGSLALSNGASPFPLKAGESREFVNDVRCSSFEPSPAALITTWAITPIPFLFTKGDREPISPFEP